MLKKATRLVALTVRGRNQRDPARSGTVWAVIEATCGLIPRIVKQLQLNISCGHALQMISYGGA